MDTSIDPLSGLNKITAQFEVDRNQQAFLTRGAELILEVVGARAVSMLDKEGLVAAAAGTALVGMDEREALGSARLGAVAKDKDGRCVVALRVGRESHGAVVVEPHSLDHMPATHERVLVAMSGHIAATLESASLLETVRRSAGVQTQQEAPNQITGRTAAPGIGEGEILRWEQGFDPQVLAADSTATGDGDDQLEAFERAFAAAETQLLELQESADIEIDDVAAQIFEAHALMLTDESFSGAMRDLIRRGMSAIRAVQRVVTDFVTLFSSQDNPLFAEKAQDVRDLGYRLIANLRGEADQMDAGHGRIIVADAVYPSELVSLAGRHAAGIVLSGGGATAHIAILARSLGLPLLVVAKEAMAAVRDGTPAVLDATMGVLYLTTVEGGAPGGAGIQGGAGADGGGLGAGAAANMAGAGAATGGEYPEALAPIPDRYQLLANVNLYRDARLAAQLGMGGIGLYRSEFPFIIRNALLSEEEQFRIYDKIAQTVSSGPVTFRTADIGGDKILSLRGEAEQNPFLGVRGIRFSLANLHAFRDQIRAMLRAGYQGDLRIMFPMVSAVEELDQAHEITEECIDALEREGTPHNGSPKLGAMIELPSAVEAIDDLAGHADFLSIGTNDLIMYLLAVDRTNARLGDLYRSYHPIVLRVLKRLVDAVGPEAGRLSICGDAAADPTLLEFFVGIGLKTFSVAPGEAAQVARSLASVDDNEAKRVAESMLAIRRVADMEAYIKDRSKTQQAAGELVP